MSSTIIELFARDPRKHTQTDTVQIVEYYRANRKDFKESGIRRPAAKALTAKEQAAKATGLDFDL